MDRREFLKVEGASVASAVVGGCDGGRGSQVCEEKDPGELYDISSQHPEIVETLKQEYKEWFKDVSKPSQRLS